MVQPLKNTKWLLCSSEKKLSRFSRHNICENVSCFQAQANPTHCIFNCIQIGVKIRNCVIASKCCLTFIFDVNLKLGAQILSAKPYLLVVAYEQLYAIYKSLQITTHHRKLQAPFWLPEGCSHSCFTYCIHCIKSKTHSSPVNVRIL